MNRTQPPAPEELRDCDYQILEYVYKKKAVSYQDICDYFKGKIDAISYRIELLKTPLYDRFSPAPISVLNTNYIEEQYETYTEKNKSTHYRSLNTFVLTELGLKVLQDHNSAARSVKHTKRVDNIKYGITTAIALIAIILSLIAVLRPKAQLLNTPRPSTAAGQETTQVQTPAAKIVVVS